MGVRAAELAGVRDVYEATVNRDEVEQLLADAADIGVDLGPVETSGAVPPDLGVAGAELTTRVDVEAFRRAFGTEWFIHRGVPRPVAELETELLA